MRISPTGPRLVAWGNRILEWPFPSQGLKREVVTARKGFWYSNGGCAMDIDGDGNDEVVVARATKPEDGQTEILWLKPNSSEQPWVEHLIDTEPGLFTAPHDILPFTCQRPDGNSIRGIVTVLRRCHLVWFEIPNDPTQRWVRHNIAELPSGHQSGLSVGDIAGHQRPDVVCGMYWAECPVDPITQPWAVRRYGSWDSNGWGGMAKVLIADVDADGQAEIVATEAEIPHARFAVFKRGNRADALWNEHPVADDLYCPHSLLVIRNNGSALLDIVVGEMSAGGWDFPMNAEPRLLLYKQEKPFKFTPQVLWQGLGVHELRAFNMNGDLVMYGADEIQDHKFPEMTTRINAWIGAKE